MTEPLSGIGITLVFMGVVFFLVGSLGFLRFPDIYARLHALSKVDTLGLGLICLGLALQADSTAASLKYLLIWLLMLLASSIGATLIASTALASGIRPLRTDGRVAPRFIDRPEDE